ncbi:hypothetical protein UFOVP815_5 [uncultured Caudovirales phage]|uniref:Polynucleotide kinase PNKP phosphatase domain-containing protein n=1 Tax=uncultured Caudovirales phage TaxID=2100421 RepID=A0A6J5P738_9CAUD|nr:hypothetical protein UFOVP815_5 [uncultured Caudovirales phage]
MKYVIFDLDNCLADDRARIPLIKWEEANADNRYANYHRNVSLDPVGNKDTFDAAMGWSWAPIFMTARPHTVGLSDVRAQTLEWIERNLGVHASILMMRNNGDNQPSVELKRMQLTCLSRWDIKLSDVACAYDDREDVVQMYREHGIAAHVLAIHDVCAYKPPPTPKRAPDFLEAGAETFRQRNAVYGDTYLEFGRMCAAIFPDGLHVESGDVDGFNRLGVFVQALSKVARYAANVNKGGHQDSAHDLMVYAAMLEEVTK